MKKLLKLLVQIFLIIFTAHGAYAKVSISGSVVFNETRMDIKNICFEVYENYISPAVSQSRIVTCSIDGGGNFKISIDNTSKLFYIGIFFTNATNNEVMPLNSLVLHQPFLFEQTDSIAMTLNVRGKWIKFEGNGADKINCQFQMASLSISESASRRVSEINRKDFTASFKFEGSMRDEVWKTKLAILESYRDSLSKEIYGRIYIDSHFGYEYSYLQSLLLTYSQTYPERNKGIVDFARVKYRADLIVPDSLVSTSENLSQYYRYLFKLNCLRVTMEQHDQGNLKSLISMKALYSQINNRYSGTIRDYLLLLFFLESGKYQSQVLPYLREAKQLITSKQVKARLHQWEQKFSDFREQNFTLTDTTGKTIALNSFKGKVVVLDFWFYGCAGCLLMPEYLEKVASAYKQRTDVVFISVNSDALAGFKLGLKHGGYTSPGDLLLYTSGLARHHPLIEFYKVNNYPTIMVIGKNSELISSRAPDPRTDMGVALKKMIDAQL